MAKIAKVEAYGTLPDRGEPAGHRHHVGLGGADVEEAVRVGLAELHRLGGDGEVRVERDDVLVDLAEVDERVAVGVAGRDRLGLGFHRHSPPLVSASLERGLELVQRLLGLLLRRRLAVEAEAALHERDAAALLRLADDRGRAVEGAAALERLDDRLHVVAVDLDRVPAEGLELGADVAGVHDLLGRAVGLEVVVVDDRGDVADPEVLRRGRRLPGLALLAVAVGEQAEGLRGLVEVVEPQREADPDGHREALAERTGRDLDAGGRAHVGVALEHRADLAELLELGVREVAVLGERGVEDRGGVALGEDEAVALGPVGVRSDRGAGRGSRGRRRCPWPRARSRDGPTWRPRACGRSRSSARSPSARAPRWSGPALPRPRCAAEA